MRRILPFVIALSLSACGGDSSNNKQNNDSNPDANSDTSGSDMGSGSDAEGDQDVPLGLSIADVSGTENSQLMITVQLNPASTEDVQVTWTIEGETASADDFDATTGQVTIIAGTTSASWAVVLVEDDNVEPDETFSITATSPIGDASASGVIIDNDSHFPALWEEFWDAETAVAGDDGVYIVQNRTNQRATFRIERRLHADGSVDPTFGTDGVIIEDGVPNIAKLVGDTLFIGSTLNLNFGGSYGREMQISAHNASDGADNPVFQGMHAITIQEECAACDMTYLTAMEVTDDAIFVGARNNDQSFSVFKYDRTGVRDVNFVVDPLVTMRDIDALWIDGDSVFIGGNNSADWYMAKLDATTGALDTAFGDNGEVVSFQTTRGSNMESIKHLTIHNGLLIVAGEQFNDAYSGDATWRVERRDPATGALDTTFGTDGILTHKPSGDEDPLTSVVFTETAMFLGGRDDGLNIAGTDTRWLIRKYSLDGVLDSEWANNGSFRFDPTSETNRDEGTTAMMLWDDSLYAAGITELGGALFRLDLETGESWRVP